MEVRVSHLVPIFKVTKRRKKAEGVFLFPVPAAHHWVNVVSLMTSGSDVQSQTYIEGAFCWPQRMFSEFSLERRYC